MKKLLSRIFVCLIVLTNAFPLFAFAADTKAPAPVVPYEKVVAKSGEWYAEQFAYESGSNLVTGYTGSYAAPTTTPNLMFEIKEATQLKGIYLPYFAQPAAPVVITLVDSKGNAYPAFPTEMLVGTTINEENASNDEMLITVAKLTYAYIPQREFVLPAGTYTMSLSNYEGAVGTFLVKGINQIAYEKYKEKLNKWDLKNNPDKAGASESSILGNEEFDKEKLDKYEEETSETIPSGAPMVFALDEAYIIDEVIVNTFNGGAGAQPGTIAIYGQDGRAVVKQQAYGSSVGDVANGAWTISPGIVFAAGNYFIEISQPEAIAYDESGEPLFYIKASPPIPVRFDFTGTYSINLDSYKTSTLMGPVSDKTSSFSLRDFQLVVLDKDGFIELIAKYEGMPFSQNAKIMEETEHSVVAAFDFAADLSKLPYKAKIGAQVLVTLTKIENERAQISIDGTGTFDREASAEKGADSNTYAIVSKGRLQSNDLPPFVMTALGKAGGVGNVPGSDTPMQTAAGILFPPLVGVVVASLQEMLNKQAEAKAAKAAKAKAAKVVKAKPVMHDRDWYKKQNPNASDETIAMIMMADAMGSTDNPDEGDQISVGDNEKRKSGKETSSGEDYSRQESAEEEYTPEEEYSPEENESFEEKKEHEPSAVNEAAEKIPEIPDEPEEMVLKTSANGAESRYVKDPITGEWVNPETGGVLDYEEYKAKSVQQFEADKKLNDADFEKSSKGETLSDKINREEMKKIKNKEMQDEYIAKRMDKYGINNVEDINTEIKARTLKEEANFKKWQFYGNVNAAGEIGATAVGVVSDTAIDALSTVTPYGSSIKAGYKVAKGVAGTFAEKGINEGSFYEGTIKGVADAATDAINPKNPYLKAVLKAGTTVAGETVGSAVGAGVRGDKGGWVEAGVQGAVDGIFKASVGAVTDGIVGDAPDIKIPSGALKILPSMKNVIVNKASLQKIGSGITDEFLVKPVAGQAVKDGVAAAIKGKN